MSLTIPYGDGEILIVAESPEFPPPESRPPIRFGDPRYAASSRHRIVYRRGECLLASCALESDGGATGAHAHCAVVHDQLCFVAVGPFICALALPDLHLMWHVRIDHGACFGVYDAPGYSSLISQGELEIARLSYAGEIQWTASGADIFTGNLRLLQNHLEVVDFNEVRYAFDIATGAMIDADHLKGPPARTAPSRLEPPPRRS